MQCLNLEGSYPAISAPGGRIWLEMIADTLVGIFGVSAHLDLRLRICIRTKTE
jgi:hypothetical protein